MDKLDPIQQKNDQQTQEARIEQQTQKPADTSDLREHIKKQDEADKKNLEEEFRDTLEEQRRKDELAPQKEEQLKPEVVTAPVSDKAVDKTARDRSRDTEKMAKVQTKKAADEDIKPVSKKTKEPKVSEKEAADFAFKNSQDADLQAQNMRLRSD